MRRKCCVTGASAELRSIANAEGVDHSKIEVGSPEESMILPLPRSEERGAEMRLGLKTKERALEEEGVVAGLIRMAGDAAAGAAAHQTCLADHESTNASMQNLVEI